MDSKNEILKSNDNKPDTLSNESTTSKKFKTSSYKVMNCKVISYNEKNKTLDVLFNGYGIRVKNIQNFNNTADTVNIQYKGKIGDPDFEYKL